MQFFSGDFHLAFIKPTAIVIQRQILLSPLPSPFSLLLLLPSPFPFPFPSPLCFLLSPLPSLPFTLYPPITLLLSLPSTLLSPLFSPLSPLHSSLSSSPLLSLPFSLSLPPLLSSLSLCFPSEINKLNMGKGAANAHHSWERSKKLPMKSW